MTKELTQKRLKELLHYDADTGVFTWLVSAGRCKAGVPAGSVGSHGYLSIKLNGCMHKAHRLAWLYAFGCWPAHVIDHKDGNRSNNAISNLRDVPHSVNLQNQRRARSDNKSTGVLGVTWDKATSKFMAKLQVDGRVVNLGRFPTLEAASAARAAAELRYFPTKPA